MQDRPRLPLCLLLCAGVAALLLIIAVSTRSACLGEATRRQASESDGPSASPPSVLGPAVHVTSTVSATNTPIPTETPTPTPTATETPAPTLTPTARPSSTPIPTPSPRPSTGAISSPFVSSTGSLAYVEGSNLVVVNPNDPQPTLMSGAVAASERNLLWSPDGRRLLYVTEQNGSASDGPGELQSIHIWDSRSKETLDLRHDVSGFAPTVSRLRGATWSPKGTRVLLRLSCNTTSPELWVLDVEARAAWRSPHLPPGTASWVDESTFLWAREEGGPSIFVDSTPSRQVLTETVSLGQCYALSPNRGYVATFVDEAQGGQRLHLLPLPGHTPLSHSHQPTISVSTQTPLWSPDGRWVAYGAEDGQGASLLLADTSGVGPTQSFPGVLPVAWSPDGRLLAGFGCSDTTCTLSLIDVASRETTMIESAEQLYLWDLAWSPRGVYLVYSITDPTSGGNGLSLWDRATGERRVLMPASATGPVRDLQWTMDGCSIYAAELEVGNEDNPGVSAIWGVGPTWENRWRVAPALVGASSTLTDTIRERMSQAYGQEVEGLCSGPLLQGRRLVAYYGTPSGRGLGILGRHGITETLELLNEQAQIYESLDPTVDTIPAFHMVTTIADAYPGPDGNYNHRVRTETIQPWIDGMRAEGGWSILDVQPGQGDLRDELNPIAPFLRQPDVHLAVDPEFIVGEDQVPGQDLGRITGTQINWLQARMDDIARSVGHRKLLIVHQFDDRMISGKELILDYPLVELVWDADGFGSPDPKIRDYNQYKGETGFEYGGLKIFYEYDEPIILPEEVLSLDPPPRLVIYQ